MIIKSILLGLSAIWLTPNCPAVHNSKIIIKIMRVTAYCSCEKCCGKYADGITASGHRISLGDKFIAAPKGFDFNTKIDVPGYSNEPVPVLDRGGAIKGDRLDVYFDTHQEALNWGVKYLEVTIYDAN